MEKSEEPHRYVPTDPYAGCGHCGIGPGAYVHNDFHIAQYLSRKRAVNVGPALYVSFAGTCEDVEEFLAWCSANNIPCYRPNRNGPGMFDGFVQNTIAEKLREYFSGKGFGL